MEFIKKILESTLKGRCELPKIKNEPKLNEIYKVIECDTYLLYGELSIRRTQYNLHHKWCEISYRGVKLSSTDKDLFELVEKVEEYVRCEEVRKYDFKNVKIGSIFPLGNKKFRVEENNNCNGCYFINCNCAMLMNSEILPKCWRKGNGNAIFVEVD